MGSGVNIDCRYVIRVKDLMKLAKLPRPTKRIVDEDGNRIPIVTITCEVWS